MDQGNRPAVELKLKQRVDGSQYIEVWVRSSARPVLRQGTIVERVNESFRRIPFVAGAIAENLCDKYGDVRDPRDVAKAAEQASLELDMDHPSLGDEGKLN